MKAILCMISRPPYQGSHDLELLEAAMVGAVFDLDVSVLFRDDGVWALLEKQNADVLQRRTFSNVLSALPTYEIKHLFACAESLRMRGIEKAQLCVPVEFLSLAEQNALITRQDAVLGAQS